ncbi:MAG: corrinoid protein, partial [Selenomonadaceae bacterium]|nr:corrinoid protein [Selenomonadaceae bacterium]
LAPLESVVPLYELPAGQAFTAPGSKFAVPSIPAVPVNKIGKQPEQQAVSQAQVAPEPEKKTPVDTLSAIRLAVVEGDKDEVPALIRKAVDEKFSSDEITEKSLTAAMNSLGEDFGAGRIFLPQVLLSAETMKLAFDELKKLLPARETKNQGTFVIATVKGDVHDLGKNIVGALVSNSGFKLVDLGKDVDSAEIVRAAIENDADIVGLCALMTTTMIQIDKVIAELKAAGSSAKVMVGGAALTQEYADSAGADAYARDGVEAVRLAKNLVTR